MFVCVCVECGVHVCVCVCVCVKSVVCMFVWGYTQCNIELYGWSGGLITLLIGHENTPQTGNTSSIDTLPITDSLRSTLYL